MRAVSHDGSTLMSAVFEECLRDTPIDEMDAMPFTANDVDKSPSALSVVTPASHHGCHGLGFFARVAEREAQLEAIDEQYRRIIDDTNWMSNSNVLAEAVWPTEKVSSAQSDSLLKTQDWNQSDTMDEYETLLKKMTPDWINTSFVDKSPKNYHSDKQETQVSMNCMLPMMMTMGELKSQNSFPVFEKMGVNSDLSTVTSNPNSTKENYRPVMNVVAQNPDSSPVDLLRSNCNGFSLPMVGARDELQSIGIPSFSDAKLVKEQLPQANGMNELLSPITTDHRRSSLKEIQATRFLDEKNLKASLPTSATLISNSSPTNGVFYVQKNTSATPERKTFQKENSLLSELQPQRCTSFRGASERANEALSKGEPVAYADLLHPSVRLLLDRTCLEKYLNESDFHAVLGCPRQEFYSLPTWRQIQRKKQANIF